MLYNVTKLSLEQRAIISQPLQTTITDPEGNQVPHLLGPEAPGAFLSFLVGAVEFLLAHLRPQAYR